MKKATKASIEIARYIYDWLNVYVPTQLTNSKHTVKSHNYALSLFISFLEHEKMIDERQFCAECFCRENIEEWLIWLTDNRKCEATTRNNRLASIRSFLKYLAGKNVKYIYLSQEASLIPRKRCPRKKINGLSRDAVKAVLDVANQQTCTGRRDLTLLILMYNTAARIDEILSIQNQHIHLTALRPYITVIGKGEKVRTLYLLPKTVVHLKRYMTEFHGIEPDADAYLFFSRNHGVHGKMSQAAIHKRLRMYAATAHEICSEVPLHLHAHQLRHARATHWLEDGMNIVQISFLLGHEQLQTTMAYLDITTAQAAEALSTLKDETDKHVLKKWHVGNGLATLCGLTAIKD